MIAINSQSYPYLAVAQLHDVPYGDVLRLADQLDQRQPVVKATERWMLDTLVAWQREQERRRVALDC